MAKLIASDWFKNRASLKIQIVIVEDIEFEIMALNKDQKEKVKGCNSYNEMLDLAANIGLSAERQRVIEDKEMVKDIELFWSSETEDIDCEPSVRRKVGLKVCGISGLNEALEETASLEDAEKKKQDQAENIVNEEFIAENGHVDLDKLASESKEAQNIINNQPR